MKEKFFRNFLAYTLLINLLFIVLYFILSVHSRLASDDFFYLGLKNQYGAWKGMMYQYLNWSGRWTAHYVACSLLSFSDSRFFLPAIHFTTLVSLFFSLHWMLSILNVKVNGRIKPSVIILLAFQLMISFFFLSFNTGETWFWYIIILTYLWSLICFLTISAIVYSEIKNFFVYLLLIVCSIYIGGASESFAIIFLFLLSTLLIYHLRKRNSFTDQKIKLILAILIIGLSFLFSALAPGTEIRHSLLPHTSILLKLWIAVKAYLKFYIFFLPSRLIYIILFSVSWLAAGHYFLNDKLERILKLKLLLNSTILFLALSCAFYLPTVIIMSEAGPDRALSILSILTAFYVAFISIIAGSMIDLNKSIYKAAISITSIVAIFFLVYKIYNQFEITKKFSESYDGRLKLIQTYQSINYTGIIEVDKLPDSGLLYWDEITADTSFFTNKHLRYGLDLSFKVKLKTVDDYMP